MSKKLVAKKCIEELVPLWKDRAEKLDVKPSLVIFLVGDHKPSGVYTRKKKEFAEKIGVHCEIKKYPKETSQSELLKDLKTANSSSGIHGILVQLPLPIHLNSEEILNAIAPEKDVDGLHPDNLIKLYRENISDKTLLPCTPKGIITLFDFYGIELVGKKVCILGKGLLVGKPLSILLAHRGATVTVCHSKTKNLSVHLNQAEIIVSATGVAELVNKNLFDQNSNEKIFVDVGNTYLPNKKLVGDIDLDSIESISSAHTPVPGGVGPMTIFSLGQNTIIAAENQSESL